MEEIKNCAALSAGFMPTSVGTHTFWPTAVSSLEPINAVVSHVFILNDKKDLSVTKA